MKKMISQINKLHAIQGLALFRIILGLVSFWEILYFFKIDLINNFLLGPKTLFPYEFLRVSPASQEGLKFILIVLLVSSVLQILGLFYRVSTLVFGFLFSYIFLLDKAFYNNHLYLLILLSFLMSFTDADKAFSFNKKKQSYVPYWQILILQFQIGVVFFWGGIAKLNGDWFNFHPVQEILSNRVNNGGASWMESSFMLYFICYGGLLFDLFIVFALLWKKTWKVAILSAIMFNLFNAYLFRDINIFPYLMTGALLLFVPHSFWTRKTEPEIEAPKNKGLSRPALIVIASYMLFQMVWPARHYFVEGYTDWTGDYQRFSWRMKIQYREWDDPKFAVFDVGARRIYEVNPKNYLNDSQIQEMMHHPEMLLQFAHYLEEVSREIYNISGEVWVKCDVKVGFNGRKKVAVVNKDVNLLDIDQKMGNGIWVNPFP
jgi:hypothetical protein